jgi:hypothetical protein
MGTAPAIWNDMLKLLVSIIPRALWRRRWFAQAMANFSQPLDWLTDQYLK